jgi:type I restriction enzyme S subunit
MEICGDLPKVPDHWAIQKIKHIGRLVTGSTPATNETSYYSAEVGNGYPWFRPEDLDATGHPSTASRSLTYSGWATVPHLAAPSVHVVSIGATLGKVGYVDTESASNQQITAVVGTQCPRFVFYALVGSQPRIWAASMGNTLPIISAGRLGALKIPIPPVEEQLDIARFLDHETAKVDALITKQEELIATLNDQRSITVDLVLDRHGFTPPRSLSDLKSATHPRGWQIIHLGTVLRQLTNGFVGPTRDILVDEGVPYIQSTHIKQGRIDFNRRPFYVRREWHDERPRIHLREGDVLIVQTGDIGKVAVVPPEFGEASCHALQIARVRPEILTGNYLGAFLSSWIGYHYLCSLATGALHPHLEAGIRAVPIVVPPLQVQSTIVRQVSEQTAKIDALIAKASDVIETLREYRSAMITDAVTGKIDVRGAA